jgi:ribosomal protein L40E
MLAAWTRHGGRSALEQLAGTRQPKSVCRHCNSSWFEAGTCRQDVRCFSCRGLRGSEKFAPRLAALRVANAAARNPYLFRSPKLKKSTLARTPFCGGCVWTTNRLSVKTRNSSLFSSQYNASRRRSQRLPTHTHGKARGCLSEIRPES